MEHFKTRQSIGVPDEKVDNAFEVFVKSFSAEWLINSNYHPLRDLWNRKDVFATS